MAVEVMAEEASGQCARACGALTRVRRACLRRARRACATPLLQGGAKAESSAHGQRDVIVCLTSSAASAFVDAEQVRSCPLAASPVTYVLGHMRSYPACARACMQKPTTWQRRDGICLFVPTNMMPLVQTVTCMRMAYANSLVTPRIVSHGFISNIFNSKGDLVS